MPTVTLLMIYYVNMYMFMARHIYQKVLLCKNDFITCKNFELHSYIYNTEGF